MHGTDIGRDFQGEPERFLHYVIPVLKRQDNESRSQIIQFQRSVAADLPEDFVIVAPHPTHREQQCWNQVIQAPSVNFAARTTRTVIPVAMPPNPFATMVRTAPGPPTRNQWPTIPACDSVNARNAPTANSGMRRSVTPRNTIKSSLASTASDTIPWV